MHGQDAREVARRNYRKREDGKEGNTSVMNGRRMCQVSDCEVLVRARSREFPRREHIKKQNKGIRE